MNETRKNPNDNTSSSDSHAAKHKTLQQKRLAEALRTNLMRRKTRQETEDK